MYMYNVYEELRYQRSHTLNHKSVVSITQSRFQQYQIRAPGIPPFVEKHIELGDINVDWTLETHLSIDLLSYRYRQYVNELRQDISAYLKKKWQWPRKEASMSGINENNKAEFPWLFTSGRVDITLDFNQERKHNEYSSAFATKSDMQKYDNIVRLECQQLFRYTHLHSIMECLELTEHDFVRRYCYCRNDVQLLIRTILRDYSHLNALDFDKLQTKLSQIQNTPFQKIWFFKQCKIHLFASQTDRNVVQFDFLKFQHEPNHAFQFATNIRHEFDSFENNK
ncbi:hypothetical protein RFI_24768 [Reticulomyxa filosa]|uniref:Uncharacterized protein n=1 Tax=Reticulomyxa filosa TaxID=46433 RepID=X6MGR1_RETFI|nr:hypothetical protein RFI_24768 [Reticulomyxa filosa]|eukprot:ETO12607.1 hypothetical protein RFI_24768 [Reticulomyxa filosa]